MKLFTKDIDDKLFEQYLKGSDLKNQVAVAKIFNPYGRGTWYLLNSDPNDPDYLWAIVDLYEVEMGSASRSKLESMKVPPFNQHLERDLGFKPVNALELFNRLRENKQRNRMMAEGGGVGLSHNAEEYLGFMREMYPKTMDIDTTTPSKDVNKAIAELELKGLIKRLSYNRGFAEYGVKNMNYENGGIAEFNDLNKLEMPIIRTQFEEEEFEYENGGAIFKRTMKTPNGNIVGKIEFNDFWKTYQVIIDGTVYEEFKTKEEAINNLKNAGFDKMALGGGLNGNFYIMLDDGSKKWYSESNVAKIPNIYFASGFQNKEDEGVAFVHYDNALRPVYKANGERADKILEYAGMEGRDIKAKGGEVGDNKFTYMMLSRLQSDNDYYLSHPYEENLWAGNVDAQIKEMKRLWNSLPKNEKPEWLSMEDISEYESKMKGQFEEGGNLYLNEINIPVIRTQFEEEDYEFEKGGEITNEERKESLKNYPKLKF